jgi:hypothetical protein
VGIRASSASSLIRLRLVLASGLAGTYSASTRPLSALNANAISSARCMSIWITCSPSTWALVLASLAQPRWCQLGPKPLSGADQGQPPAEVRAAYPPNRTPRATSLSRYHRVAQDYQRARARPGQASARRRSEWTMSRFFCCFAAARRENEVSPKPDKFSCDLTLTRRASLSPAILDCDIASIDPTEFAQLL